MERVINGTDHIPISEYAGRAGETEGRLPHEDDRQSWNSARIATELTGEGGSLSDAYKRSTELTTGASMSRERIFRRR
jgi:hypothetical protein